MALLRGLKHLALVALLVAVVASMGGVSGSIAALDGALSDFESGLSGADSPDSTSSASPPDSPTAQSTDSAAGSQSAQRSDARTDLNESRIELLVHRAVNDYRADAGADPLEYDHGLGEVADYHSDNMADDGRIYHVSPSGESFQDRYERFDYDCRVPADGNRYYVGGENVAQTWYEVRLTSGEYYDSEERLAEGLARQWFESEGHRENMLKHEWRRQGIGVEVKTVDGNTAIYATQNFC